MVPSAFLLGGGGQSSEVAKSSEITVSSQQGSAKDASAARVRFLDSELWASAMQCRE